MELLRQLNASREALERALAAKSLSFPVNLTAGLICAALGLVLVWGLDGQVMESDKDLIGSKAFPLLTLVVLLGASLMLIIKDLARLHRGLTVECKSVTLLSQLNAVLIFLIFVISYAIGALFSFLAAALFLSFAFLVFFKVTKLSYYLTALSCAVLIWAAFHYGLKVRF